MHGFLLCYSTTMSESLQLDSECHGYSTTSPQHQQQEERQKLAKKKRDEQLKRYYEWEQSNNSQGSQESATRNNKGKKSQLKIRFQHGDVLRDAFNFISTDRTEVENILQQSLASPDHCSEATGVSLLHQCCLNNDLHGVQLLLKHGANVNIKDYDLWTPLHIAAACGHTEIVETLLECNADPTLLDVDGNFAYDSATTDEIKSLLLKYMSFMGVFEQDLKTLRSRMAKAMFAAVKEGITQRWNLNRLNKNGVALLHITAANGYRQIARLLLDGGADINIKDDRGYTPLHVAAKFNQVKLVKLLLKRKPNSRAKSFQLELPVDLTDLDEITYLLHQAGGERKANKVLDALSPVSPLQSTPPPLTPSPITPSPTHSEADNETVLLTPNRVRSVNIDLDEFECSRTKSRSLNRDMSMSKLEELFEAETLSERDTFDEGTDKSTQAPALRRLRGSIFMRRESVKLELPDAAVTDNLATLSDLNEPILLNFLRERYQRDQIYTYIGEILVAVNPFKALPFYTNLVSDQYLGNSPGETLPPHVFAVANQIYWNMVAEKKPQSCVISGESGAGKTETCKLLVQHLLYMTQSVEKELNIKIEQVNPILEAFGNAQTVMNNNSSRFGKYLELVFSSKGHILGANFKEYLLEKSRVIFQAKGERNFHIFYQLFGGLSKEKKMALKLSDPSKHRCLTGCGASIEDAVTSEMTDRFQEVIDSLQAIGFTKQDEDNLLQSLAAVLHVCDVCFEAEEEGSKVTNMAQVKIVADLLQVDSEELALGLVQEVMITRGEQIVRNRTPVLASDCRDALAKALYGRMFGWIVNGINHHLEPEDVKSENCQRIGVLDIFGFENFEKNSFEQMCINVANEQLQNYFNDFIFKWEQEECATEGITIDPVLFPSNLPVLELFLEKNTGLFALIDEDSKFPRATDVSMATKMHKTHGSRNDGIYHAPPNRGALFGVHHYAGYVEYDVTGFLDKNRDTLPPSILLLMKTSGSLLVREIFGAKLTRTGTITPSRRQKMSRKAESPFSHFNRKASKRLSRVNLARRSAQRSPIIGGRKGDTAKRTPPTVANHFRNSLAELMDKIKSSSPHFVRCIKPNTLKQSDNFDVDYVQKQLKYTGVMETVKIRQCGFPTRLTFGDFVKRYQVLKELHAPNLVGKKPVPMKKSVGIILEKVKVQGWVCGENKVLLKFNHPPVLERECRRVNNRAIQIQRCFRNWQAELLMKELLKARQEQARKLKSLLDQASAHSEQCYIEQEALNEMDVASYNQSLRHANPPPAQGWNEEQYMNVRQVKATLAGKHDRGRPAAPIPAGFVLPTSPPYDHLEDDVYDDLDGMGMEQQRNTQRIRSIPSQDDDDVIMVGANIPSTIFEDGNMRGEDFEVEEIYDNTVGLMDDVPYDEYVEEIYDDSVSVMTTGALPPPVQINRRYSPLPPPPQEDVEEEIYDDSSSLVTNFPPPKTTTQYRKNAPLPPPPPPTATAAAVEVEEDEGIYDDSFSLMTEPPLSSNRVQQQTFKQASPAQPAPPPIEEDIYDDSSSLVMTQPLPPRHSQQIVVPVAPSVDDDIYDDSASLLTQPPVPKAKNQPQLPPQVGKWGNTNASMGGKSLPLPPPPIVQDDVYEDTYSMKHSDQNEGNEQYTLLSSVRVTDSDVSSTVHPSLQARRSVSPSPPPIPRRSPDTHLMGQQQQQQQQRSSLLLPPSGGKTRSLSEPAPPPLPSRSPHTRLSAEFEVPQRRVSSEEQQQIPRRVSSSEDVFVPNSSIPPLPPRRESLTNVRSSRKISSSRRSKVTRTRSEDSTQSSVVNQPRFSRVSASDPPSVSSFQQRRTVTGSNNNVHPSSSYNASSKTKLIKKLSDPSAIRSMPLPPLPSQPEEEEQKDYEYIDDNQVVEFYEELDKERSPQSYTPPIRRRSEEIQAQSYTPPLRRSSRDLPQPPAMQPQGYTPPIRRSSRELPQPPLPTQGYSPPIRRSSKDLQPTNSVTSQAQSSLANKMPKQFRPVSTPASALGRSDGAPPLPPVVRVGDRAPMPLPPTVVSKPSTNVSPTSFSGAPGGTVPAPPPPPPVIPPTNQASRTHPTTQMNVGSVPPPPSAVGVSHGTPAPPPPPPPPAVGVSHATPAAPPPPKISTGSVPPPPPITAGGAPPPPPPPPPIGGIKQAGGPSHVPSQPAKQQSGNQPSPPGAPGMSGLLAGLSSVQLKKASDRELPSASAQPPQSSGGGMQANLMAEMQSFQLRKTKKIETETPPSTQSNKPESDQATEIHSFQLRKTKRPGVDTPSNDTDGTGASNNAPALQFQLRPTQGGPNKQLTSRATPPLKAKPIKPQPPPPKPKQPIASNVSPPPPPPPHVGNGHVASHDPQTNGNMPEWKRAVMMKKQREQEMLAASEQAKLEAEETKWSGVPAWKRKILEEKEKKAAIDKVPQEQLAREEAEKAAKLEGMPDWKRNLVLKKQ